ncbi:MAG: DUF4038 domain-containing protein [Opitutaceae bacterium]|nr:DUF4038 domain-containing protein [Verrucomicrobiales bacterium]
MNSSLSSRHLFPLLAAGFMSFLPLMLFLSNTGCVMGPARKTLVSKWSRFEASFVSATAYTNPIQQAEFRVTFTSPTGDRRTVPGFWDGGATWRIRFAPDQPGEWIYTTECSDVVNRGLHRQTGRFTCVAPTGASRFSQHGPIKVAHDGRFLIHDDRTPFFWVGDTAWNGPMKSTPSEWEHYLHVRNRQKFNAVQWVTTQFRAAPDGDREHRPAFTGSNSIALNIEFFRRLDDKVDALTQAGLLNVPVLLWSHGGSAVNPGVSLPEDQAILLARYMVARWQANPTVWMLNGDGDYRGAQAEKWKRIGRAVFGDIWHAPVTLHPGGRIWVMENFKQETWLDLCGYQSGHNDSDDNLRWIFSGPASTTWKTDPARPYLSLEAPYENHNGARGGKPMDALIVRRAHYWSLLNAPVTGVTYGGHGVWGWDDGTKPPVDHPNTGIPLPLKQALVMPGAEQMAHLATFFNSIDFWRLRPAPEILGKQPGVQDPRKFISAVRSDEKDLVVVYTPEERIVSLMIEAIPPGCTTAWINPRNGERRVAVAVVTDRTCEFPTPDIGDWLLLIQQGKR